MGFGVNRLHKTWLVGLQLVHKFYINIKKVQKQDLKNIKNLKGCRDGIPKSICKQGRDAGIVKIQKWMKIVSKKPSTFG